MSYVSHQSFHTDPQISCALNESPIQHYKPYLATFQLENVCTFQLENVCVVAGMEEMLEAELLSKSMARKHLAQVQDQQGYISQQGPSIAVSALYQQAHSGIQKAGCTL